MLAVDPLTPALGAEVSGLDIAADLRASDVSAIENLWLEHKVLILRDQHVSTEDHLRFASRFGSLEVHPFAPSKPGYPEVLTVIANKFRRGNENTWHSDVTWRKEPSLGSILRAVEVPSSGGDTLFADMEAAYKGLDTTLRNQVDDLSARHDLAAVAASVAGPDVADRLHAEYPPEEHPVIRTHPVTGRRSIYVNAAFTTEIVGLSPGESERVLALLYRQASVPEYQVRVRWRPGTVVMWDNRCVQHYAVSDYWPETRVMERVTIVGDAPR